MAVLERYTDYDRLAWFYDRYWGLEYPSQAIGVVDQLLLSHLPRGAHILDLCCGTGHLTRILAQRGFRVTGIDGSAEMLRYAREKAPQAEFRVADARSFSLPERVDAVLSTFESLNHILSIEQLEIVFENVHAALVDGGVFVFDLLMEEAYRQEWSKSSAIVQPDHACIVRGGFDPQTETARTEITMFRLERAWQRSDVIVQQRCYSLGQIWSALEEAGFNDIGSDDAQRSLGMTGRLGVGRTFFRAKKDWTG